MIRIPTIIYVSRYYELIQAGVLKYIYVNMIQGMQPNFLMYLTVRIEMCAKE